MTVSPIIYTPRVPNHLPTCIQYLQPGRHIQRNQRHAHPRRPTIPQRRPIVIVHQIPISLKDQRAKPCAIIHCMPTRKLDFIPVSAGRVVDYEVVVALVAD